MVLILLLTSQIAAVSQSELGSYGLGRFQQQLIWIWSEIYLLELSLATQPLNKWEEGDGKRVLYLRLFTK